MRQFSASDELKQLLAMTEQCAAQARVAKQQAQRYAQHFKVNAEEFRKLAARSHFPDIRARLLRIAASNERLCNIAEGIRGTAEAKGDTIAREPLSKPAQETVIKPTEDPVAQARRHVAEAEARIERQEALLARLSYSGRHVSLARQASEILSTLNQTHRLAHDHLEYKLNK